MAQQYGADPGQLRALAQQFINEATAITESSQTIDNRLGSTWWKGDDAAAFDERWHGSYRRKLTDVASMLREVATRLSEEAQRQEAISSR